MAPGMEARCIPVRMASVSAASRFSAALAAAASAATDVARLALLHPTSSVAAAAQPHTMAHRRRARRRGGAARDPLGVSGCLPGPRLIIGPPFGVDGSERVPGEGVRYVANVRA